MKELLRPIAAIALSALVLLGAAAALRPVAERNRAAEREAMMARLLPGGSGFVPEEYTGEDENIRAVLLLTRWMRGKWRTMKTI